MWPAGRQGKKENMIRLKRKQKKMNFAKKVWILMEPFHRQLWAILVITTVFETLRMGSPYIFGKILDLLIKSKGLISPETALYIIAGLAGVRFMSLLIDYVTDIFIVRMVWGIEHYVSTQTFAKYLELSLDYHEKINTGTKISLVNKGTDRLVELIIAFAGEFQPTVIQLVVSAILITLTSWVIGLIFTVSLIPFVWITFKIAQATQGLREKRHDTYEISSGEVGDTLTNISVVKAFAQEDRENKSYRSIWEIIKGIQIKEYRKDLMMGFSRNFLIEIFYAILLIIGVFQIKNGTLTIGSLVFLINMIERAYTSIYRLGRIYKRAADSAEAVDRISNLFRNQPTVANNANPVKNYHLKGQISFKHLTFAYNKRRVLKNISFTIPAGSFTAIVGKSGGGKSTVAKLLSRYYDPTRGSIVIDGKYDLRKLDLDTYRSQVAVVFQDSPVPNRKIWEVISYAAGQKGFASVKNRVIEAAKLAHADDFIKEFDDGYQTQIGERGVKLSGGQKQRIAIARALFAEPKILLMDEPTSHLDTVSEAQIQKALEEISAKRTLTKIVIAHRLSTVQKADQILVMERGKLVEHGTHSQLLKKNGVYAQIVKQSELKA